MPPIFPSVGMFKTWSHTDREASRWGNCRRAVVNKSAGEQTGVTVKEDGDFSLVVAALNAVTERATTTWKRKKKREKKEREKKKRKKGGVGWWWWW